MTNQSFKSVFMNAIDKILNSKDDTIKVLQANPTNCMLVVKRESDSSKDNNPVSSTMIAMNRKYPISVDREKALKYGVPSHFLANELEVRVSGRILCKREAILWWMTRSPSLDDDQKATVDLLLRNNTKMVMQYNEIDWEHTTLNWGITQLPREKIRTNEPIAEIPRQMHNQALIQLCLPEYNSVYDRVPESTMEKLREGSKQTITSNLSLNKQLEIIKNAMDSKLRTLPAIPGAGVSTGPIRYLIAQPSFFIKNIIKRDQLKGKDILFNLIHLGKAVVHNIRVNNVPLSLIRDYCRNEIRYYGVRLNDLFDQLEGTSNCFIKVLQVFCGIPIEMDSDTRTGFKFSPNLIITRVEKVENIKGTPFNEYHGNEVVNFTGNNITGTFTHDSSFVSSITTNILNSKDLKNLIAEIGIYCRFQWRQTKGKTCRIIAEECRTFLMEHPWTLINATPEAFEKIEYGREYEIGCLKIIKETCYNRANPQLCTYNNGTLESTTTNHTISIPVTR